MERIGAQLSLNKPPSQPRLESLISNLETAPTTTPPSKTSLNQYLPTKKNGKVTIFYGTIRKGTPQGSSRRNRFPLAVHQLVPTVASFSQP